MSKAAKEERLYIDDCPYAMCAQDDPTKIATLGWRFAFILFGWIILGKGIAPGNSFFTSLTLLASPLFIDYLKFRPRNKIRIILRNLGLISSSVWMFFGFLGMGNILFVNIIGNESYVKVSSDFIILSNLQFPVSALWGGVFINVFLACIDWVVNESPLEKQLVSAKDY